MPENYEVFQPMTNLKHVEQMTDIDGGRHRRASCSAMDDWRPTWRRLRSVEATSTWFVYDRASDVDKWHKHCGPYSTFEQAKDWIKGIREAN